MSRFEVVQGVEGCCLALDHTRIAGPKPWGGGTVIHAWETDEEYKAVDTRSRWYELFGTPERTARMIIKACDETTECNACPIYHADINANCSDYDALLEWMRSEA